MKPLRPPSPVQSAEPRAPTLGAKPATPAPAGGEEARAPSSYQVTITNVPDGYTLEAVAVGGDAPGARPLGNNVSRLPAVVASGRATVGVPRRKTDVQVFTCATRKTVYMTFTSHSDEGDGVLEEDWTYPTCDRKVFTNVFIETAPLRTGGTAPSPGQGQTTPAPTAVLSDLMDTSVAVVDMNMNVQQGSISGTITDSAGAVIAGAEVCLSNPSTGSTRLARSDEEGVYRFTSLGPGTYTVTPPDARGRRRSRHRRAVSFPTPGRMSASCSRPRNGLLPR